MAARIKLQYRNLCNNEVKVQTSCSSPHKGNLWFLSIHPICHWGTAEFWQLSAHFPDSPVFRASRLWHLAFQKDISPSLSDRDCQNYLLPLHGIELDYFLDYPGTSSNKFLQGMGTLTVPLITWARFLWFSRIGGSWATVVWFPFLGCVIGFFGTEHTWCWAVGPGCSGSPFHLHPVSSWLR